MAEKFTSLYRVSIGDINYGGHLGNDKALVIFQDSRICLLQSLGYSEMDIGEGKGIIMVESGVRYLREVFLHDQLTIAVSLSEMKSKKLTIEYDVMRMTDKQHVLSGFTLFLAFDYATRTVAKFPQDFRDKLSRYLHTEPQ